MTTRAISLLATVFVWFVACSSGTDSNPQPSSSATGDPAAASTSTGGSANSAGGSAGATTASSGGTGGGGGSLATPTLTFQVDVGTSYQGAITVGNSVDGWDMAGKIQLVDPDQDGVYVGTMELPADTFMEYKFIKGSDGNGTWEDVPLNCGLKTDVYINRTVVMPAKDTTLPVTDFSACPDATPLADCNNAPGRDVPVTIQGASLRVGNQALHMKGVAWSPTAVGSGPGYGHGDFDNYASIDVPLFVQAGINTVRTYGPILNRSVLDKLYSEGIYVVNTVFYGYEDTVTSAVNNLCAVKDHPAIIAWVVGNEWNYNYNDLGLGLSFGQARAKVAEVVNAIQAQDSTRPVSTVYGEMPTAETYAALSAVDLWGLNVYRGASFGDLFTEWKKLSSKPMYVS